MKALGVTCVLLIAMGRPGHSQAQVEQPLMFTADLRGALVAPAAIDTPASGKASGVLVGNRFTVHGTFSGLSSALRDIEKKPDDPGIHLHRGAPGETTPYFHGLQVRLNADGGSGILDEDQLKRLLATQT